MAEQREAGRGRASIEVVPLPGDPGPEERSAASVWGGRLILGTLLTLLLLNVLWMGRNVDKLRPVARGGQAPDFSVPRLGGGTFHLAETRGHPILVDFWATWCGPCRQSLPILDKVYATYRGRGLQAIAVEMDGAASEAQGFMQQLGLTLPVGLGGEAASHLYGVSSIPHLVLIDREGRVRRVFRGVHGAAELGQAVEEAGL